MHDFKPGQRWICDADLQMGLGTVQSVEGRVVSIAFMAVGETRSYAKQSAPLTRVVFNIGDTIASNKGLVLDVTSVKEQDGLIIYSGTDKDGNLFELAERQLAHHLQFSRPTERLFNGHIDQDKWFQIRYQTLLARNQLAHAPLYGLVGTRTSLIPHQLYIAHEVANRYAPRVLLADEVGLGKTIEAGLILHQQLLTERVKRILIVVPETLVHQWLVEMLRRFNLHFSVFDEERYETLEESDEQENPFHSEQLILCSLSFLGQNKKYFYAALDGDWDLLVVDEAHHLQWSEQSVSPEYDMIEQLAACTKGVLLLTATPEQLGKVSHFARLRLLDSDRFANFADFVAEEQSYEPIAKAVEALLEGKKLNDKIKQVITSTADAKQSKKLLASLQSKKTQDAEETHHVRKHLAEQLLDRHGTGRILFRNTRAAVKGFPQRKLHAIPLALPAQYFDSLTIFETEHLSKPQLLLCPELLYQARAEDEDPQWIEIDPRINWLNNTLKALKPEKVLIITAHAQTARDIAQALKALTGQHIPVFNEHMSLLERDRAAAFFADIDAGSQLLVCSEIGSEGRNFQFSHHLILFDLPLNPDLLEQRIGRLDRIGQTETINIYAPYLENSAQAIMFNWYQQGLNAFEKTCPAGQTVFSQVEPALIAALHQHTLNANTDKLINKTQSANKKLNNALDRGRDKLLEYNSFRPVIAEKLRQLAIAQDSDTHLPQYMDTAFDCFGVHVEEHRAGSYLIEPSEHMTTAFPGLNDEGMVITYTRDIALANEDMRYLTWEHPIVIHAMDRVLSNESGNAVVTAIQYSGVQPGTLFLESLYILETRGHYVQQSNRYLPPTMIRTFIDEQGGNDHPDLDHATINQHLVPVTAEIAKQVIQLKNEPIKAMVDASLHQAETLMPTIVAQALDQTTQSFTLEIERLKALHKVNPNVREEEIRFFEQQLENLTAALNSTHLRLDALRVIVAT
jgi:ATP-dependent helicase HepA